MFLEDLRGRIGENELMEPTIILERKVPGLTQHTLGSFVVKACRAVGLRGVVTVLITGNRQIRQLNSRFRGKNHSTDVLSFPALLSFPDLGFANGYAGDIAVSLDVAGRNARSMGHSISREVQILVLHGILHLAGYDHESDAGEMARKEQLLRQQLALPTGLIERSSHQRGSNHGRGKRAAARRSTAQRRT